jgi:hypothetical protein
MGTRSRCRPTFCPWIVCLVIGARHSSRHAIRCVDVVARSSPHPLAMFWSPWFEIERLARVCKVFVSSQSCATRCCRSAAQKNIYFPPLFAPVLLFVWLATPPPPPPFPPADPRRYVLQQGLCKSFVELGGECKELGEAAAMEMLWRDASNSMGIQSKRAEGMCTARMCIHVHVHDARTCLPSRRTHRKAKTAAAYEAPPPCKAKTAAAYEAPSPCNHPPSARRCSGLHEMPTQRCDQIETNRPMCANFAASKNKGHLTRRQI